MIESATARTTFTGNNTTVTYAYGFKVFDEDHLKVTIRTAAGVESTLVITTDYTVTGVGEESGGNIVLVDANQAWMDAVTNFLDDDMELVITRNIPLLQDDDYANQTDFYPENHERTYDKLLMMIQQLNEQVKRCVKVSVADYTEELFLPSVAVRASQTFGFDSDGLPTAE